MGHTVLLAAIKVAVWINDVHFCIFLAPCCDNFLVSLSVSPHRIHLSKDEINTRL